RVYTAAATAARRKPPEPASLMAQQQPENRLQPGPLHEADEEKRGIGRSLRDIILGGQDGLVNVLGVVLGVAAATQQLRIIMAAALPATFSESIAMAGLAYTSSLAARDYYLVDVPHQP